MSDEEVAHPLWDETDIFRGEPPVPPTHRSPSPSLKSIASKASLSSSHFGGGRLGAIAAVVELAISRWAGNEGSTVSSAPTHSTRRTRPARSQSERRISRRILQLQAREESRQIPRQFELYLPPSLAPTNDASERAFRTSSLDAILSQLDITLKKSTRFKRRQLERDRPTKLEAEPTRPHLHYMLPAISQAPSRAASFTDLEALATKGKQKVARTLAPVAGASTAWFLDVASPTWEDMHSIGKLLHLHPLTLEDILMKDPREKLEHFPKLGYYFLSFRAIESWDKRQQFWDHDGDETVSEFNIYLIVFNEGVCCFHFSDIASHLDRVRNRLVVFEQMVNMSSDWIAHGILDSVVDSFFPFLQGLEREVMAIESLVFEASDSGSRNSETTRVPTEKAETEVPQDEKGSIQPWGEELTEKNIARLNSKRAKSSLLPSFSLSWRRTSLSRASHPPSPTALTLKRMAQARRMVTSLARLLAAKGEVVAQLRKRLLTGSEAGDRVEVAIYLGDVQDHILTLETSLGHYERMLSQSHPTYISHLRTIVTVTKRESDIAVMFLSCISLGVLCVQTLIGLCSVNVLIPRNALDGHKYNGFCIVLALAVVILTSYVNLVRYWWRTSKRRRSAPL
ncbi:unnamed protein product [Mycena citricolor]|uniref:Uncharacterized protein n=1 Tax=Mycena citricolor TaxID=2018698 RepID=A0AAD2HT07_9AGAR|nr:unnamed protein product [Mycena citricolor]